MKSVFVAIAILISFGYFFYKVAFLARLILLGKPENRFDQLGKRTWMMIRNAILQLSNFKRPKGDILYAGIMHFMIFWGFMILLLGEIEILIGGLIPGFTFKFLGYPLYNLFLFSQDFMTTVVIIAMIMSFARRFIWHPKKLNYHFGSYLILSLITGLMLTLFAMNVSNGVNPEEPVSKAVNWMLFAGTYIKLFHVTHPLSQMVYEVIWWLHVLMLLFFLDFIPNSKHLHLLGAIPNNFFLNLTDKTMLLQPINFEAEGVETFGVSKFEELTWKQLLDGAACTECGRCTDDCPAANTGKILSPREIILGIKENMKANGPKILKLKEGEKLPDDQRIPLIADEAEGEKRIAYKKEHPDEHEPSPSISPQELWACTTCGACQAICPVANEHIRDIIEMRRYLVMTESKMPQELSATFRNNDTNANPWGLGADARLDWAEGLGIKTMAEQPDAEILYWVGCAGAYDDRNKKIAIAFVKLLQAANVKFAVLGTEEACCGDWVRRAGNEYAFQALAKQNIETLNRYNVKKIVTACPHGYYTLKHDYPEFGGNYEVIHHSQFINQLIKEGRLKPTKPFEKTITYHDSCYLGRHNNIYSEPRNVISAVPQVKMVEMKHSFANSFCCGAGGGRMWIDEKEGERINRVRTAEALSLNPDVIATACPFCMTMIDDGVKDKGVEDNVKVLDIAEIVQRAL
ncbi:MAG: (Fe-S)-binding protein [bacterium]